ncbi:MAG: hypothetical protein ACFB2X_03720 [Rivularia sp. (in: cyanobacteria)]
MGIWCEEFNPILGYLAYNNSQQ